MKRFLPFILISSVVLQFFAPFAIDISKGKIQSNFIYAAKAEVELYNTAFRTNKTIRINTTVGNSENADQQRRLLFGSGNNMMSIYLSVTLWDIKENKIKDEQKLTVYDQNIGKSFDFLFDDGLVEDTEYKLVIRLYSEETVTRPGFDGGLGGQTSIETTEIDSETITVRTLTAGNTTEEGTGQTITTGGTVDGPGAAESNLPDCGFRNVGGCIARIFYYVLFVPTSFLFGLAGKVMDFTIMYSVSDSSYRTPFVSEGWKVVRDLCNMFFIFILLYIAITTILDVGSSKNKSQVVNVIIIGLFINFSLFATHLIIDASNIMARVFYNPKVLVIGEKDKTSGEVKNERDSETGTIQLSQAIVSKINPQRLLEKDNQNVATSQATGITNSSNITTNEDNNQGITAGTFILVTLMASIVNFIGMMTFLTISLSFIGRVVGLWVAMVLSPLAFLSYTVPETKKWDYVGWSSWWSETVKTAFMAPVFVFFMYIIVMFLESGIISNVAGDGSGLTNFNKILSVIIPFIVIIVLLKQAEKISTKLAGQVAGTVTSAVGNVGARVGGLALGGALGAGAFAMRSTIGKMGAGLTNSEKLIDAEKKGGISGWGARQLRNVGSFTGKSSFDVRSTKVGQTAGKQMGVEGLGKGKAGGYVEYQNSIEKRKTARADTFKSSDAKAAEQDAAAKDYNDKYQKSLYAKKLEMENDRSSLSKTEFIKKWKTEVFNEKEYKETYKNDIKEQEKNERIQELARENKAFDQKEQDKFEKEYTEKHKNDGKSSEEIYRDRVKTYKESVKRDGVWGANDSTMARIDKSLKDKSKDPNAEKPLTHKENFLAERNKTRAKDKIDEVEKNIEKMRNHQKDIADEMDDINKDLEDVANIIGQPIAKADIKKEHIKQAIEKVNGSISEAETRIISLNNILAQNPGSQVAQRELAEANKAKREGEAKIKSMSNVLERKNKNKEKETTQQINIERQESIIEKQKEIIEKEQETIDKYEKQQKSSS